MQLVTVFFWGLLVGMVFNDYLNNRNPRIITNSWDIAFPKDNDYVSPPNRKSGVIELRPPLNPPTPLIPNTHKNKNLVRCYMNRILRGDKPPTIETLTWFRNALGRRLQGKP